MLRVPFADLNCTKLPGTAGDKWEDDFVLLADIFPTGYYATKLAMVQPGASVAVFGAGPVGLLTAYSALLQGAAQVFVVDYIPERLDLVKNIGAIPIDFTKSDPVAQIKAILSEKEGTSEPMPPEEQKMATVLGSMDPSGNDPVTEIEIMRAGNPAIIGSWLPGEEKMKGVMCGIDAVGYQARDRNDPSKEKTTQVLDDLIRLINPTGHLGVIGVYMANDPGATDEHARKENICFPSDSSGKKA